MKKPIIYISGPIQSPVPGKTVEQLKQVFYDCEAWLENLGYISVNPLKVGACPDEMCNPESFEDPVYEHTWHCFMRYDIKALMNCDAVVRLPRWGLSRGARVEIGLAGGLDMPLYDWRKGQVQWKTTR